MGVEIRQERDLPFPVDRVWTALTDADELAKWAQTTDFRPVVGSKYHSYDEPNEHWNGIMHGEVLEVEPPHRLVTTWNSADDGPHQIEWTLTPTAEGTHLQVRHDGFAPDWQLKAMMEDGYRERITRLNDLLETGEPQRERYEPRAEQLTAS